MDCKVQVVGATPAYVQVIDANGVIVAQIGPVADRSAGFALARKLCETVLGFCGSTLPAFAEDDPSAYGYKATVVLSGREGVP